MNLGQKTDPAKLISVLKFSRVIHFKRDDTVVKTDMPCHSLTVIPVSARAPMKPSLSTWPHTRTGNGTSSLVSSLEINNLL